MKQAQTSISDLLGYLKVNRGKPFNLIHPSIHPSIHPCHKHILGMVIPGDRRHRARRGGLRPGWGRSLPCKKVEGVGGFLPCSHHPTQVRATVIVRVPSPRPAGVWWGPSLQLGCLIWVCRKACDGTRLTCHGTHFLSMVLLRQLCGTQDPKGNPGYPPHIYAEEGECEQADSLSSLTSSEHDLPPDLLDSLGPKAAPLEEIYSESAFHSPQNAYFGWLE